MTLALLLTSCSAERPFNPSFPLSVQAAREDLRAMRNDPMPPLRPVVVIGGIMDFGPAVTDLAGRLKRALTREAPVLAINIGFDPTMDDAVEKVIEQVDKAFPSEDQLWTAEVDVVGFSLGGVLARYAASERPAASAGGRRLRIARLFTLGAPHLGTPTADFPTIDSRIAAIRPGSAFLTSLDESLSADPYEIVAYVRLDDLIVRPENAGVGDTPAYWVANMPLTLAHSMANIDPRILADIARRLRGQPPHTVGPPTPIPRPGEYMDAPHLDSRDPDWLLVFP